jgi:hypothetical protein
MIRFRWAKFLHVNCHYQSSHKDKAIAQVFESQLRSTPPTHMYDALGSWIWCFTTMSFLFLTINTRAKYNSRTEHLINETILYYWEVRWSGSPTSCWLDLVSKRMINYHVAGVSDWRAYIRPQILCIYVNSTKWSLYRDFFRCHYFG